METGLNEFSKAKELQEDHVYVRFVKAHCHLRACFNTPAGDIHGPKETAITEELDICKKKSLELCNLPFYKVLN